MIPIKDKKFLKCIRNTIEDLKYNNVEELDGLKYIYQTRTLTILSVSSLYIILKTRELHIDFTKQNQDKHSFKIINKEHAYMKRTIERYFDIGDMGSTTEHISCYVTKKDSIT